ncbi:hypothetical protein Bca4012_011577 [Brassica carinata]
MMLPLASFAMKLELRRICVKMKVAQSGYTSTVSKICYLKGYTHTASLHFHPSPPMHLRITEEEAVEAAVNVEEEEENETQATALRSKKRKQRSQRDSTENVSSQASLVLRA